MLYANRHYLRLYREHEPQRLRTNGQPCEIVGDVCTFNRLYSQTLNYLKPLKLNSNLKNTMMSIEIKNGYVNAIYSVLQVYIDASAEIHPTAKIGPNVSIGARVRVGPGVRIRESIILQEYVNLYKLWIKSTLSIFHQFMNSKN